MKTRGYCKYDFDARTDPSLHDKETKDLFGKSSRCYKMCDSHDLILNTANPRFSPKGLIVNFQFRHGGLFELGAYSREGAYLKFL